MGHEGRRMRGDGRGTRGDRWCTTDDVRGMCDDASRMMHEGWRTRGCRPCFAVVLRVYASAPSPAPVAAFRCYFAVVVLLVVPMDDAVLLLLPVLIWALLLANPRLMLMLPVTGQGRRHELLPRACAYFVSTEDSTASAIPSRTPSPPPPPEKQHIPRETETPLSHSGPFSLVRMCWCFFSRAAGEPTPDSRWSSKTWWL